MALRRGGRAAPVSEGRPRFPPPGCPHRAAARGRAAVGWHRERSGIAPSRAGLRVSVGAFVGRVRRSGRFEGARPAGVRKGAASWPGGVVTR